MNLKNFLLYSLLVVATACGDRGKMPPEEKSADARTRTESDINAINPGTPDPTYSEQVLIASDIVTEVIIRPDPEGDPWEIEKVAGYSGDLMINSIFDRIYAGTLTAYDYHSGEPLTAGEVRKIEKDYANDRSKIGKLSFTEDWYYNPPLNRIDKVTKSIVFGFELYNNERKVYAYRAAFKADLSTRDSTPPGNNP